MLDEYEPLYCKCGAVAAYLDYATSLLSGVPTLCTACYDRRERMGQ